MSSSESYPWKILRNLAEVFYNVEYGAFTCLRTSFKRSIVARKTGHDPHTIYLFRGTMASFYTPIIIIISPTTVHAFLPCVLHAQICCDQRSWLMPLLLNSLSNHSQVIKIWGMGSVVKNPPVMQETQFQSLGREDPLGKGMATHSSILAWRIQWTEETGRLLSIGSIGGSESKESACNAGNLGVISGLWRLPGEGNGLPTPVFLPGESNEQRSLAGYSPWGLKKSDWVTNDTFTLVWIMWIIKVKLILSCG